MARPRLNRNGLWAKNFGKIFQKIAKNCRNFPKKIAKIFQKIVEIFQKIVENSKKIPKNPTKIFQKPLLLPINLRATLKVFLHTLPNPLSKP
jgi:hypothetical protein